MHSKLIVAPTPPHCQEICNLLFKKPSHFRACPWKSPPCRPLTNQPPGAIMALNKYRNAETRKPCPFFRRQRGRATGWKRVRRGGDPRGPGTTFEQRPNPGHWLRLAGWPRYRPNEEAPGLSRRFESGWNRGPLGKSCTHARPRALLGWAFFIPAERSQPW